MRIQKSLALIGAVALGAGAVVGVEHLSWPVSWPGDWGSSPSVGHAAKTVAAVQWWHCGMHPWVIQDHPGLCPICHMPLTPIGGGEHVHGQVSVDPTIVQNMGVRTAKAVRGPLTVTIQASGMVKIPDPAVYEIAPKTTGWITHLYADTEGMHLHKGEVLFDYYSPELQSAAAELIYAARALRAAGGESDVHRHEIQTRVAGARQQLTVRDVADRDIDALIAADHEPVSIPIRSPASGELMDKMVVQGASVQMGSKVMRIEDHGKLWLDAEIFENQMTGVAVGAPVTATFDALPGRSISSKVSLVFPHVDQVTRTEIVRSVLDPADSALKPGMYAMVNIVTEPVTDAVLIPREAVIDSGSRQVVFVALDGGHFQARQVHVGITGDNDQVQILDGIAEGEPVVTSGQFLLDVESRTLEAIDKLQQPSDPATQPGELIKGAMP